VADKRFAARISRCMIRAPAADEGVVGRRRASAWLARRRPCGFPGLYGDLQDPARELQCPYVLHRRGPELSQPSRVAPWAALHIHVTGDAQSNDRPASCRANAVVLETLHSGRNARTSRRSAPQPPGTRSGIREMPRLPSAPPVCNTAYCQDLTDARGRCPRHARARLPSRNASAPRGPGRLAAATSARCHPVQLAVEVAVVTGQDDARPGRWSAPASSRWSASAAISWR